MGFSGIAWSPQMLKSTPSRAWETQDQQWRDLSLTKLPDEDSNCEKLITSRTSWGGIKQDHQEKSKSYRSRFVDPNNGAQDNLFQIKFDNIW